MLNSNSSSISQKEIGIYAQILRNNNHSMCNPLNNSYVWIFCVTRMTGYFPKTTMLNILPGPVEMNVQVVGIMSIYSWSVLSFKYKQTPPATPEIKYQNSL